MAETSGRGVELRVEVAALRSPQLWLLALLVILEPVLAPQDFADFLNAAAHDPIVFVFALLLLAWVLNVLYLTCWSIAGAEILSTDGGQLHVERKLFGRTLSRRDYQLECMDYVLVDHGSWHPFSFKKRWGFEAGPVLLSYQGQRVRVAEGLRGEDALAEGLAKLIRREVAKAKAGHL